MKKYPGRLFLGILIFGSGPALGAGEHAATDPGKGPISDYRELTANETTIQAVLDTYGRAMEQKSVEIMEQAIIPNDFSTVESGYPNWTWEDFRDNHLLLEMDAFTDISYSLQLISGELQDSLGFGVYRYTASGKMQGQAASISGLGTAILELTDAGWRIQHLHTSAPRQQLEGMSGEN
ncbi:MAG: nuclear transport factor 2 family protein [Gammaproteobacteria bacterium]|jgi:hypothetical protein|nr:hypothetical protein [Chromatiales bacterium]MDP6150903.1 nuclear transport factor 2 family protein [Gammaproteobacteria bacterium]MDP7093495.1 nuclear transport factor 2 family protein [Gammaproteobacteria bacterium]MDP7271727.1 nuclear transport factor 2 family protein [Gammaproteobacteria bacterium]MDP7419855.1 nuclear transport factor 2 family protein [Gammaproteobacteria bacterium]